MLNVITELLKGKEVDIHYHLIEQCRKGKQQYYKKVYSLYSQAMFNICLRILGNRQDAEDILQEAFADAFHTIHKFRFESSFGAWLKRIVVNKCISYIRKMKIDMQFINDIETLNIVDEDSFEENCKDIAIMVERVKSAMGSLPEGSRTIFSLYLFEGYDHVEISEIMNITESTSKTQYMRAREKIKNILLDNKYERR